MVSVYGRSGAINVSAASSSASFLENRLSSKLGIAVVLLRGAVKQGMVGSHV